MHGQVALAVASGLVLVLVLVLTSYLSKYLSIEGTGKGITPRHSRKFRQPT